MMNQEAQEDELLALASIYDGCQFEASQQGDTPGGRFSANLDLPEPFYIKMNMINGNLTF